MILNVWVTNQNPVLNRDISDHVIDHDFSFKLSLTVTLNDSWSRQLISGYHIFLDINIHKFSVSVVFGENLKSLSDIIEFLVRSGNGVLTKVSHKFSIVSLLIS